MREPDREINVDHRVPSDGLRKLLSGRPHWMNGLMLFCLFMTFIYVPWDIFIKPVEVDQEVWFGIMFTGWAAKLTAIPHWGVYAAGAYGFWKMAGWMWPWAAAYAAQVAIGMAVWALLQPGSAIVALVSFIPFAVLTWAVLTWALWNSRPRFGTWSK